MDYLPSKKFIAPVFAVLVVIFVGWFIVYVIPAHTIQLPSSAMQPSDSFLQAYKDANQDSDNDGLKDWEEVLWHTDPRNKDTDGDGTEDGEEVKLGRNPTKSGPDDKLENPENIRPSSASTSPTLTGKIAEDFALKYFMEKGLSDSLTLNAGMKSDLVNSLISNVNQGVAAYQDIFAEKDIKISEAIAPKKYLNLLASALDANFKNINKSELDILSEIADSGNFTKVKLFDEYIAAYKKTVEFLKNQPVPKNYSALHLMLLNSMENTKIAVSDMRAVESDPALTLVGLQLYLKEAQRAKTFLTNLKSQTKQDNIVFSEKDAGSFFNKYFKAI